MSDTGISLIAAERERQQTEEGHTAEKDDRCNGKEELVAAAVSYCLADTGPAPDFWPWASEWWKPTHRVRDLTKAGALIAAEIDRLLRLKEADDA